MSNKILLVDDDKDILEILSYNLMKEGFEVEKAKDGISALKKAKKFLDDFITIIDESHVTLPQVRAMYGGDKSRKTNLVEHGFKSLYTTPTIGCY